MWWLVFDVWATQRLCQIQDIGCLDVGRTVRAVLAPGAGLGLARLCSPIGAKLHRYLGRPHKGVVKVLPGGIGGALAFKTNEPKMPKLLVFGVFQLDICHLALGNTNKSCV